MDPLGPPPSAGPDRERLSLFLRRVMALATAFALLELAAAAWFRERRLAVAAGLLLSVSAAAAAARALARRGSLPAAAEIVGYSMLAYAVANGWCLSYANPACLLVPVLAVTASLPYLTGVRLRAFAAASLTAELAITAYQFRLLPAGPPGAAFGEALVLSGVAASGYLSFILLTRFTSTLRESLRLREDFLSVAGHELRTPVTALHLFLENLARKPALGEEAYREENRRMLRQVARLNQLIDRLLDVSRITAGRLVMHPEAVDLRALVVEVIDRHAGELRQSGSPCALAPGGEVAGRWDRMRLEQIVTNLLSNAIKYGEGKPVEVGVAREGDWAALTVRDQGIGISAEDQQRIFQRFERAVSGYQFAGLGLGLWIVRQVVEAMGGSIQVSSRPGEGATFTVRLPTG